MKNKKLIKRVSMTLGVLFLFSVGFVFGSTLDTWEGIGGKQHVSNTEKILDDLDVLLGNKNQEKDEALRKVEQMVNQLKDKDNKILSLENKINNLENATTNNEYKNKYENLLEELKKQTEMLKVLSLKGRLFMKNTNNDDIMNYDLEKVPCVMVQGELGNLNKLIDFNNERKKIMLEFLEKLEEMGIEFFGTSIRKDLSVELDGVFSHVDKSLPFDFKSFEDMVLGNGLTFEGKYALATYNPDEDDLKFEIKK